MYNLSFRKIQQLMLLFPCSEGIAGAATVLSWCRLGLCSCLWLCTTICSNVSVWDLAVLSSDQSPAGVTVPAARASSQGWAERSTGSPRVAASSTGRKLVGLSSATEQLPQSLPKARPQELPRPSMLALTLCHHSRLLSAVNAGCSSPWLLARY